MAFVDVRFYFDEKVEEDVDLEAGESAYKYLDFTGAQRINVVATKDYQDAFENLGEEICQSDKWQEYLCGLLYSAFEQDDLVPFKNSGW